MTATDRAAATDTPPTSDDSPRPRVGSTAALTHRVRAEDGASRWGNDLPVLATPVLLWLSEIAAMRAVDDQVPEGWITLGAHHDSAHEAPTPIGEEITVRATLVEAGARTLVFDVEAHDGRRRVLSGRHTRGLVRTARFHSKYGL